MVESPLHTDTERSTKKRRRIPRACDRCRLKKSKVVAPYSQNAIEGKLTLMKSAMAQGCVRLVRLLIAHAYIARNETGECSAPLQICV